MPKRTSEFRKSLLVDLADPQEAAYYFNAAAEDSEQMALVALRDIAEATRGMATVAKDAGVAREAVYRMLSDSGNPAYHNLSAILKSVGLKIEVRPIQSITTNGPASDSSINVELPKTRFASNLRHMKKEKRSAINGSGIRKCGFQDRPALNSFTRQSIAKAHKLAGR